MSSSRSSSRRRRSMEKPSGQGEAIFFPVCSRIRGAAIRHDKIATHTHTHNPSDIFFSLLVFSFLPLFYLSLFLSLLRWGRRRRKKKKKEENLHSCSLVFLSLFIYIPYTYSCLSIWKRGKKAGRQAAT